MLKLYPFEVHGLSRQRLTTRANAIEEFTNWITAEHSRAATPRSLAELCRLNAMHNSYPTLKNYFNARRTNNDLWGCLCNGARDVLEQRGHRDIPSAVMERADLYRANADALLSPTPTVSPSEDDLRYVLKAPSDDLASVTAAATLAARLLREVKSITSTMSDPDAAAKTAVADATEIAVIAENFREVLTPSSNDEVRRAAIPLFEAGADALRLLSRNPDAEHDMLYRLLVLRRAEFAITADVRDPITRSLAAYHRDAVQAVLMATPAEEISTVSAVIGDLQAHSVRLRDQDVSETDYGDQVVAIVLRLASYGIIHTDRNEHLRRLADDVRQLFPRGDDLRTRMRLVLDHAGLSANERIPYPTPIALIHLARYRGVGEFLVARALVTVASTTVDDDATDRARERTAQWLRPFGIKLPAPTDVPEEPELDPNRILLHQRAVVFYNHAIEWLRRLGTPGALRKQAIVERDRVRAHLAELGAPSRPSAANDTWWLDALHDLEHQFDTMMAAMILRTDFTHAKERVLQLSKFLQYLRGTEVFLSHPRGRSLGSDLPPLRVREQS